MVLKAFPVGEVCYETKKCGKRFPYILVEKHYFISLWWEREGTWPGSHMTLHHKV